MSCGVVCVGFGAVILRHNYPKLIRLCASGRKVLFMSLTDILLAIEGGLMEFRFQDAIDILIVAAVFYLAIRFMTNTRAYQVLKGVAILLLVLVLSNVFNLFTVRYLIGSFLVSGIVVVVVLFQPEIRRALERIGRFKFNLIQRETPSYEIVRNMMTAIENMSRRKVGALIVCERNTKLNDQLGTGIVVDAAVSDALIENIFEPKTPLHDGAMVIRDGRIYAAACVLPLFDDPNISKELGTRHRAALGISVVSDSVTLVVSEETGVISYARDGKLVRYVDHDTLETVLNELFCPPQEGKVFSLFGGRRSGNDETATEPKDAAGE